MTKNKIKVLHIIKSLGRGGAEMLLPETLKVHHREHLEFEYLYFLPWKNQMVEAIELAGAKVFCIPANNNIQLIFKVFAVAHYVRENNITLIHSHLPWAGILSRIVGIITGVPVIYTEHNKQERYHFITRWMNLVTMNSLSAVVAVSHDVEQSILKFKPRLKAGLHTILNGVDIHYFAPGIVFGKDIRDELRIPRDAFVIGTVAVFRVQKRLEIWLEIAKEIISIKENVHFIIVGDGPLKTELLLKIKALGLEDKVHLVGLQKEVRPYLAAFDLYMISSMFEGLPIALLEAMASGIPVISTDAGGIKEVIKNEQDGLLCSVDDPKALTNLAVGFINNQNKGQQFGLAGRRRVVANFSLEKMVGELELLYEKIYSARYNNAAS